MKYLEDNMTQIMCCKSKNGAKAFFIKCMQAKLRQLRKRRRMEEKQNNLIRSNILCSQINLARTEPYSCGKQNRKLATNQIDFCIRSIEEYVRHKLRTYLPQFISISQILGRQTHCYYISGCVHIVQNECRFATAA